MKYKLRIPGFFWILIFLNVVLALYATPVTDVGDATAYIRFSQSLLGRNILQENFAHRSPLYSILLAGLMLVFKPAVVYHVVIYFHYLLLAITVWTCYLLFRRIFSDARKSMFAALLFNLSFSTLFYANLVQTEILTVFLLVLTTYYLVVGYEDRGSKFFWASGLGIGLLSLTRYNAVPLIFTFLGMIVLICYLKKFTIKRSVWSLVFFLIPYLIVINAWCLYNQQHNGFYGLFPRAGNMISRNVIVASIRNDNSVSPENKPLLDIFLKAREDYLKKIGGIQEVSLADVDGKGVMKELSSGYGIYAEATPALKKYLNFSESAGEHEMAIRLSGFYREIARQNQSYIFKSRFMSLLAGFAPAIRGELPAAYGRINLNILPPVFFQVYSIAMVIISMIVFVGFFFFTWSGIKNGWRWNVVLMAMYLIIFSFWAINFAFVTTGDANRFKFPVEPFIFGISIYHITLLGRGKRFIHT